MTFCACRIVPVLLLFRALVSLKLCACSFFTRTLTVCVCVGMLERVAVLGLDSKGYPSSNEGIE